MRFVLTIYCLNTHYTLTALWKLEKSFTFNRPSAAKRNAIVDICDEDKTAINNLVSSATMTNSKKIENNGVVVLSQEMMAKGEKLTGREI
ncbi:3056_t:CDS:2 [Entrophospora sp. SA101]|nr:3958_t:CDS:2 [Entrophospora sp. SA101]CAJ0642109.1 3056_t:CDS:2 [Entrophospora sp. SA101]CAJ0825553.1 17941_t:CDS:2 [Entrophospora sp. SA101]CAJ0837211.1 4644_t:CDS:2 [Entrophospora sp. SA101]CAJ0841450.1 2663_t:CDS:2 [Entrophospora sp. SA101]